MRRQLGINTFDAAVERLIGLYAEGHRIVCCFSGGKDSGVCLELCLSAAKEAGRLPVDVSMRDEEIMFPGTFEYSERAAARHDVDFHWIVARQPIVNIFNRESPYWWMFDPQLQDQWVREPPDYRDRHNRDPHTPDGHPRRSPDARRHRPVHGDRPAHERKSELGAGATHSSGGRLTKPNQWGSGFARPIYDWQDGDVWKAMGEYKWDYNSAYDVMHRHGHSRKGLRIAPPTMTTAGISLLQTASRAWPQWFDRVCTRLPGVRTSVMFGRRALEPVRKHRGAVVADVPARVHRRGTTLGRREVCPHLHDDHQESPGPLDAAVPGGEAVRQVRRHRARGCASRRTSTWAIPSR